MTNQTRGGRGAGRPSERPTKADLKDEARREREEIRQRMTKRRRNRTIAMVAGIAVALAVVILLALSRDPAATVEVGTPEELLAQAADAQEAAGCDAATNVGSYGGVSDTTAPGYADQAHVGADTGFTTMPPLSTYPSVPPASGPHGASPLAAGVYDSPPDLGQVIHSLEHGGAVVWYSPSAPAGVVAQIKAFYSQPASTVAAGQDRVIVAPYDYPDQGPAGGLQGAEMALVSWHIVQACAQPSLPAALDFTSQYSTPLQGSDPILGRAYLGEAPEPGAEM